LAERYPKVAAWLEEAGEEALAVYALPAPHRKRMRSTNMLERWHQELKRRTRVVRVSPDGPSCLRLVTALSMETSEEGFLYWYFSGWTNEERSCCRPTSTSSVAPHRSKPVGDVRYSYLATTAGPLVDRRRK